MNSPRDLHCRVLAVWAAINLMAISVLLKDGNRASAPSVMKATDPCLPVTDAPAQAGRV